MIGGNVATHAGGVMYCKYGPMRAYVLGLGKDIHFHIYYKFIKFNYYLIYIEVVLPDGRILNMESEVRKDNTL